jgi:hypothetical protein
LTEKTTEEIFYCSFCGKTQHEVAMVIAGPAVYICDECIFVCLEILEEQAENLYNSRVSDEGQFISHMNAIKRIDPRAFYKTCGYIKGTLEGVSVAAETEKLKKAKAKARKTKKAKKTEISGIK